MQFVKKKNIYSITGKFIQFSGDFVDRVTPVPIPNTEVKPVGAEGLGRTTSAHFYISGDDLLSHVVSNAVPSALEGLTSVFGMGTGVTPPT